MVSNSKVESLLLSLQASLRQDPEPMVTWTQPRERQWTNTCIKGTMYSFPAPHAKRMRSGRVQCVEEIQDQARTQSHNMPI